jgi:hypothetical protein
MRVQYSMHVFVHSGRETVTTSPATRLIEPEC